MKAAITLVIVATLIAFTVTAQPAATPATKEITLKTMPPSVVKTVPQAGDTAVDPALKEIAVTFSKDMKTNRMWAVCQISKETYPETAGQIHYLPDQRTCVVPVKLEPGKTYVLWFNRGQFNSFRDTENNPSVPYLLVFKTRK
jgi:hypothetical protein